jgi:copper chaperone CopZ
MRFLLVFGLICIAASSFGQKNAEISFKVEGVCGMCETRIVKAFDLPGILNAEWDIKTKKLTVAYKRNKFTEEQLHGVAAKAGHDTEVFKASEENYAALHGCCKYREEGASGCQDSDQD